jgi:hypothetical protein
VGRRGRHQKLSEVPPSNNKRSCRPLTHLDSLTAVRPRQPYIISTALRLSPIYLTTGRSIRLATGRSIRAACLSIQLPLQIPIPKQSRRAQSSQITTDSVKSEHSRQLKLSGQQGQAR